jgi:hypothetical protein
MGSPHLDLLILLVGPSLATLAMQVKRSRRRPLVPIDGDDG